MPIVMLVRHAENDFVKERRLAGRIPGVHLNERGRAQADVLAEYLKQAPIQAIYSSPLERARETAEQIAALHDVKLVECDELNEIDYGDWQGQRLNELRRFPAWKFVQQRPSLIRFPNGVSFSEAQQRVCLWLLEECHKFKPKEIFLCVSHCDLIKLIIAYFIGLPLDHFQRLNINTSSLSAIRITPGKNSELLFLNLDVSFHMKNR